MKMPTTYFIEDANVVTSLSIRLTRADMASNSAKSPVTLTRITGLG
jgi:hypothetical protein